MIIGSYCSLAVTLLGTGVPGSIVTVRAAVGNLTGAWNYFWVTGDASGVGELPYQDPVRIPAGSQYTWNKNFTMPSMNCTVTVYAWFFDETQYDPDTGFFGVWVVDIAEVKIMDVAGSVTPTLSCTSSLKTGETLSFDFTGFQPNSRVHVSVSGGTSLTDVTANSSGAGSGSLPIYEAAGSYNLFASDAYGHSAYATFTVTSSQMVGWVPALYSLVNSGQLTKAIVQTPGWVPALYALVNSAQLTSAIPQIAGWKAVLYALANSSQLTSTIPQSYGWMPVLYALVNSGQLVTSVPSSFGWFPALSALVKATLPLPKPPEEGGMPSWVLPVAIVGGAAVIGTALALSQKDKISSAVSKKTTKK